jgi:5-methylcytosine-specific restriction enzyme B
MSLAPLFEIIHSATQNSWSQRNKTAFEALFGSPEGRYPKQAAKAVAVRAPEMSPDSGVPFAAYIHPSNPASGPYSGLSFVIFPVPEEPCLVGLGIGTQGLSPDEAILGRPGHARKAQAICSWLNREYGSGSFVAWAKQDPTRTDLSVPNSVKQAWPMYKSVFDRYGKEMYALYRPTANQPATEAATTAFLDLLFEERSYQPITSCQASYQSIRGACSTT